MALGRNPCCQDHAEAYGNKVGQTPAQPFDECYTAPPALSLRFLLLRS